MWQSNIHETIPIEYQIVLKDKTKRSAILKWTKSSTSKPNGKPPPGDYTLVLDPDIRFYEIEEDNKTEEGEEK